MCEHETVVLLGTLGDTTWARCRHCGLDVVIDPEEAEEE